MQAYRGLDIGTAKPSREVRQRIPYRMIDVVEPEESFTVREYQSLARQALEAALESHGRVIVCGGSGLHFRSIVDPLSFAPTDVGVRSDLEALDADVARRRLVEADPDAGDIVDLANPRRVVRALEVLAITGMTPSDRADTPEAMALATYEAAIPFVGLGIDPHLGIGVRIERRLDAMLEAGLLDEVAGLRGRLGPTASQALGYKELLAVLEGRESIADARATVLRATSALVKRQRTFFRRDPRIAWQPWQDDARNRVEAAHRVIEERTAWTS